MLLRRHDETNIPLTKRLLLCAKQGGGKDNGKEGEKHVTITINIQNNFLGDIENLYNNLVE